MIHEGVIDLNPPYQRGKPPLAFIVEFSNLLRFLDVVWPEAKQIGLIDSIFRNFYIPPIVFAVQRDEEGEEVRICVDGKQVWGLNKMCGFSTDYLTYIHSIAPNINTEILGWSSTCIVPHDEVLMTIF